MTGGNDLNIFNSNPLSEQRDLYEKISLFQLRIKFQFLVSVEDYKLLLNILDQLLKVSDQVNTKHNLKNNKNSLLAKELESINEVNSFHNFAVDKLGHELKVLLLRSLE